MKGYDLSADQPIRIIPVVLTKNGRVVQSKGFKRHQVLGNPSSIVWRLSNWFADELIYLDITRQDQASIEHRSDLKYRLGSEIISCVEEVASKCFMPLTVGGGIRTTDDIYLRLKAGADKVAINSEALNRPEFIKEASSEFGSQCIVVSIDVRADNKGDWKVFKSAGRESTFKNLISWIQEVEALGAGEILLNSIDQDGQGQGYDLELIKKAVDATSVPVIALGGVGNWQHFARCIEFAHPSAVAAANIFQYVENSYFKAQRYLYEKDYPVRRPEVKTIFSEGGV